MININGSNREPKSFLRRNKEKICAVSASSKTIEVFGSTNDVNRLKYSELFIVKTAFIYPNT